MDYKQNIQEYLEEMEIQKEICEAQNIEYPIKIHNITHDDMLNGEDLGVVLWVAGCSHKCKECHNPITWDENGGIPFTEWEKSELFEWVSKPWTGRVTFSGGDPLYCSNREYIGKLAEEIKTLYPDKQIWVYTGYQLENTINGFVLKDLQGNYFSYNALKWFDVLVDGPFMCNVRKADIESGKKVLWRGSSNQRVIDVQETLARNKVVVRIYDKLGNFQLLEEVE